MPVMLPFVVVNSWSIFVSFNVMRLFDAKLYHDFAQKYSYTLLKFHLLNQRRTHAAAHRDHAVVLCCHNKLWGYDGFGQS